MGSPRYVNQGYICAKTIIKTPKLAKHLIENINHLMVFLSSLRVIEIKRFIVTSWQVCEKDWAINPILVVPTICKVLAI